MTTSPSNIPAQAVEVAARVLKSEDENPGHNYPQIARLALEAALPHLIKERGME